MNNSSEDFEKFYSKKHKASGTHIRQWMQKLKVLAQEIRVDIQKKKV